MTYLFFYSYETVAVVDTVAVAVAVAVAAAQPKWGPEHSEDTVCLDFALLAVIAVMTW